MQIKVCGLKIPENIRAVMQLDVHFVGFIFYEKSPRHVTLPPEEYTGFDTLRNSTVKKVGVFVNATIPFIMEKVKAYDLDYVQLHGNENVFYCSKLKGKGVKIIKAFSVDDHFVFTETTAYQYYCDYFLFDTKGEKPGGNGAAFDWSILHRYKGKTPFFISGGIRPGMEDAIRQLDFPVLYGLDLNSGFEIEPGYKSVTEISQFLYKIKKQNVSDW